MLSALLFLIATFLPLKLPSAHLLGVRQPHLRYLDTDDSFHRDQVLRDRAIDGAQTAAARVGRQHAVLHGARLLMVSKAASRERSPLTSAANLRFHVPLPASSLLFLLRTYRQLLQSSERSFSRSPSPTAKRNRGESSTWSTDLKARSQRQPLSRRKPNPVQFQVLLLQTTNWKRRPIL